MTIVTQCTFYKNNFMKTTPDQVRERLDIDIDPKKHMIYVYSEMTDNCLYSYCKEKWVKDPNFGVLPFPFKLSGELLTCIGEWDVNGAYNVIKDTKL